MSKWKKQLDHELGTERKFHEALEKKILAKVNTSKKSSFTYPTAIIGVCLVAMLLFFIGPTSSPNEQSVQGKMPLLKEFVKEESVGSFYVSYLFTQEDFFVARANTFALGSKRFSSKDDIQSIMLLFRDAVLANDAPKYGGRDIVLKFTNGEIRKIKVYDLSYGVGILDVNTNVYYESKGYFSDEFEELIEIDNFYELIFPGLLIYLITISLKLIKFRKDEKAPYTTLIAFVFIISTVLTILAQGINIVLSIWLPVGILIALALYQLVVVKRQGDFDKTRNLSKKFLILLGIWTIILVGQFLGGIL